MTNVHDLDSARKENYEQACFWLVRIDRGLSPVEEKELDEWLAASEANREQFLHAANVWDRVDGLARLADVFPEPLTRAPREPHRFSIFLPALAAGLLVVVGLFYFIGSSSELPEVDGATTMALETELGERARRTLSDGTSIVLNTNSRVVVRYTPANRILDLQKGEMHVKVAHDPNRPLSVLLEHGKIVQAIGTEFNVEITDANNVEIVVTEGVVMIGVITAPLDTSSVEAPLALGASSLVVAAGQSLEIPSVFSADDVESKDLQKGEIAVRLSWREGNLIFQGESLEDAVSEIGRYTAVEFVFLDEEAKKIRVAGLFKAGDVDGLLSALRHNFNITYEWVDDGKIALSSSQ